MMSQTLSRSKPFETEVTKCVCCFGSNLEIALEFPKLPITGAYTKSEIPQTQLPRYYSNTNVLCCADCGHTQLGMLIDPEYLYSEGYLYRTSQSQISASGLGFFEKFLDRVVGTRHFNGLLEFGCNDLALMKRLHNRAVRCLGVDPIWKDVAEKPDFENVKVVGDYIQNVDLGAALATKPDLIVSTQVLEHVVNPAEVLRHLVEVAAEDAIFVLEVPSIEKLMANLRFDHIFYQHFSYFSMESLFRMIGKLGCEYLAHEFHQQYWGSLLVAFRKPKSRMGLVAGEPNATSWEAPRIGKPKIQKAFLQFKAVLAEKKREIEWVCEDGPVYGYGASLILPTLGYHMETDFGFLKCVLDDDPRKNGLRYVNLNLGIEKPSPEHCVEKSSVLVLSPDHARPILNRVFSMNPKRILTTMPLF